MQCLFDQVGESWKCSVCGRRVSLSLCNGKPYAACRVSDGTDSTQREKPPGLLTKAANFASSVANHVASGMPCATQEEIDRRFAICQQCEHFDGKACRQCGCPVVREKQFISKLSWANEKCPAGKWGPENRDGLE